MKHVVDHVFVLILWLVSATGRIIDRLCLWWELRNNHGTVAIMLFYSPEDQAHRAAEQEFTNLQRKFEDSSEVRFQRFVFRYNEQFSRKLKIDPSTLPAVVCEWSRLLLDQRTSYHSRPITPVSEKQLEQQIRQFLELSAELAQCRQR